MASVTLHAVTLDGGDDIRERDVTFTATMYRCIIGRSSKSGNSLLKASNDNFRFDNRVVSRNHAELVVDAKSKEIHIKDIYSLHGTWLNDSKLTSKSVLVSNGDTITLGATVNRGEESFKPVKIRIEYTWKNPSRVIPSCELPSTNTYTVPEDEEDSEVESGDECGDIIDVEHDPFLPWQEAPSKLNLDGEIISIKSSLGPVEPETESISSPAGDDDDCEALLPDDFSLALVGSAIYPTPDERPTGASPFSYPHSMGHSGTEKPQGIGAQLHTPFPRNHQTEVTETSNTPWYSRFTSNDFMECPPPNPYTYELKPAPPNANAPDHSTMTMKAVEKPITDQVEPTLSFPTSTNTCGTKRKLGNLCDTKDLDSQDLPDAQPQETFPATDTATNNEFSPPPKRAKSSNPHQPSRIAVYARYAATAITGAIVGGVGTVVALASLPPGYFD
ncbi:hypothetical protein MGYG_02574 [Nannizzia gypsea CBS 118893]|uniref:FHA domain-containing protein n=1 Tax=Arthroderma gypseum (strain ATCC MYA-4604 / CBS 118893) TaxID=535722 RepID=E4UNA1_ARTGP|nr:hypothetical protein MGYG_02574 [Nannizzia gypsea CBS 118893]EFQ99562.1 hypothetical protein MGYG_02574 [Nannizzia gypsea CBS 118893]